MTAYELRISDWSSDVCSSDLAGEWRWRGRQRRGRARGRRPEVRSPRHGRLPGQGSEAAGRRAEEAHRQRRRGAGGGEQLGRATSRESVSRHVSVLVDAVTLKQNNAITPLPATTNTHKNNI